MMLPLPRTGPSSRCRLQFTTKIRLSSFSREASVSAPSDSGSSRFAVAQERPNFATGLRDDAAILQVPHEARLIDRRDRAEPHRYRRELPEVRHQPGMRIGRQPGMIAQLMAEIFQMLFVQAAFEKRPAHKRPAKRGPGSTRNRPARLPPSGPWIRAAEEMVVADLEQRRQRRIGRQMAADVGVVLVGAHHHGQWRSSGPGS